MAATPLSILVLFSQQRSLLYAEHVRSMRESARAGRRVKSAASQAYIAANEAYLAEGCRVLYRRTVVVHSLQEIEALMALFEIYQRPYRLKRVIVNGPVPTDGEMINLEVERMRETLEAGGFVHVKGNTYALPNIKVE